MNLRKNTPCGFTTEMKAQSAFTDHLVYARLCDQHDYNDNMVPETVHIRQQPQGVTTATVHHRGFWNAIASQGLPRWRQLELGITVTPNSKVVQSLNCASKSICIRRLTSQLCTSGLSNLPSLASVLFTVEWGDYSTNFIWFSVNFAIVTFISSGIVSFRETGT